MTKEDIQLALRLVAHGRVNHPQVEELAEKLAQCFASAVCKRPAPVELPGLGIATAEFVAAVDESVATKRRKKAE